MKKFIEFSDAYDIVKEIGISNISQWREWVKNNKDKNIPYNPDRFYKNKGWINFNHFWGKEYRRKKFIPYESAKNIVNEIGIKNHLEFLRWITNNKNTGVPTDPNRVYKNKGWVSWGSFLGTNNIYSKNFMIYGECKEYLKDLKLNGYDDFNKWLKTYEIDNIPYNPHITYKNKGWVSWGDFLSSGKITNRERTSLFLSYSDCKEFIKKYNFKSVSDFNKWENRTNFIPSLPAQIYKDDGWISWGNFLGTNNISQKEKGELFLNFEEAKKFVQKLNFKHKFDYYTYVIKNNIEFLPKRPEYIYRENWIGYLDYLGCDPYIASYGEDKIKQFLDYNNIEYVKNKTFNSCRYKNCLPFDFYLPKLNVCIEYDGEHHYIPISRFGGDDNLKRVQFNDAIKTKWCL